MQFVVRADSAQVNDPASITPLIEAAIKRVMADLPATKVEPIFNVPEVKVAPVFNVPQAPAPTIQVAPSAAEVKVVNEVKTPRLIGRKGKTKVNRKRGEMESTETEERYEYEE